MMTAEVLYRKVGDQFVPIQPTKPPVTRAGSNHEVHVGDCTAVITVNRKPETGEILEVFGRADAGMQGHLDQVCTMISLGIQGRCDLPTVIAHLQFDRTEPCGGPGQPSSIYDALAKVLRKEVEGSVDEKT